jgi:hypothetical protein
MPFRPIVTHLLTQLDFLELSDHPRRKHKCDQECGHSGVNDAKALVSKDIEEGKFRMERI